MFDTAQDALTFIQGGNATFTVQSGKTGDHLTFNLKRAKGDDPKKPFFVRFNGEFLGTLWQDTEGTLISTVVKGRKGAIGAEADTARHALHWVIYWLKEDTIPEQLTIQHDGSCCRCNRQLTHPDSLASGIGPECAKRI